MRIALRLDCDQDAWRPVAQPPVSYTAAKELNDISDINLTPAPFLMAQFALNTRTHTYEYTDVCCTSSLLCLQTFTDLVFLRTVACPYSPHTLHCTRILPGTVLVIVSTVSFLYLVALYQDIALPFPSLCQFCKFPSACASGWQLITASIPHHLVCEHIPF